MNNKFKKENRLSLNIFKNIDKLNYKSQKRFKKINLVNIFALEIQKYLSSSLKSKIYNYKDTKKILFPFVNNYYLEKNIKFDFKNVKNQMYIDEPVANYLNKTNKQKLIYYLNNLKFNNYSHFNIDINKIKIKFPNLKNIKSHKIYFSKLFIKNYTEQLSFLKKFINYFAKKHKIKNKFYSENFINFISIFLEKKKIKKKMTKNLLVGSNMNIFNRIMSTNFLMNNKKVFSICHANYCSSIYEDPTNEIGEYSFCNIYYDLGKINYKIKFTKSNFFFPKVINKPVRKITNNNTFINQSNEQKKILYLPNSYNFFRRYGYHRDIDDETYFQFQKKILSSDKRVFLKKHPKSKFNYKNVNIRNNLEGNFSSYLNKFDLYIVDMISQPFFSVAETNSKILYLSIDQRKIRSDVLKLVEKRAYVVSGTLDSFTRGKIKKSIINALNFKIVDNKIMNYCT